MGPFRNPLQEVAASWLRLHAKKGCCPSGNTLVVTYQIHRSYTTIAAVKALEDQSFENVGMPPCCGSIPTNHY
jgi:hypothetical protein